MLRGLAFLVVLFVALPLRAEPALVIDGATLDVRGETIRLLGIDVPGPEMTCRKDGRDFPCGDAAKRALEQLIVGVEVRCEGLEGPRYGPVVIATCRAEGLDLGGELVRQGWARADRRYSSRYVHLEADARQAGRGLWAAGIDSPWR